MDLIGEEVSVELKLQISKSIFRACSSVACARDFLRFRDSRRRVYHHHIDLVSRYNQHVGRKTLVSLFASSSSYIVFPLRCIHRSTFHRPVLQSMKHSKSGSDGMLTHHPSREQDKEATVYIGNLDERVSDSLVWELMLQAGRIVNVHLPKDRVTQTHQGYGFVEFISEEDADYAAKIMNQVRLYGKPIRVNKASADKQKTVEIGAELFVGNLDPTVDERTLFDTFSRFGSLIAPPKVRLYSGVYPFHECSIRRIVLHCSKSKDHG